jgi:hypothetical protein
MMKQSVEFSVINNSAQMNVRFDESFVGKIIYIDTTDTTIPEVFTKSLAQLVSMFETKEQNQNVYLVNFVYQRFGLPATLHVQYVDGLNDSVRMDNAAKDPLNTFKLMLETSLMSTKHIMRNSNDRVQ